MDNLMFEKIWQDGNLMELRITGISEYARVYQNCYIEDSALQEAGKPISEYTYNRNRECYVEFGNKEGNFTPAFSMKILPAEPTGHMKLELDFEIADNDTRGHRACFYIRGKLGLLDSFGKAIQSMGEGKTEACALHSK